MREDFHSKMDELVDRLVRMADIADEMLGEAMLALTDHDAERAQRVRLRDDEVDELYSSIQRDLIRLMALQAPVAGDLRRVSALIHVNLHVERLGDYAAGIAKMGRLSAELSDDHDLLDQLNEMAAAARTVGREAMRSFVQRDVALASTLPKLDDRVDTLNIGLFKRLVAVGGADEAKLEWATHMILVARQLERYGDHAVDIGEQTIFAVTGSTVELSSNTPSARPA